MSEEGSEHPRDDLPVDDFELHARKWAAEDGLLKHARELEEVHGLDPRLRHDLEEAFGEDDADAWRAPFVRFLEALVEARA